MQINELYETAINYAEALKQQKPHYFTDPDSSLCLILTENDEIYSAVNSVKLSLESIKNIEAEFNALMYMIYDSKSKAEMVIILSLADYSLRMPTDEWLDFLIRINETNNDAQFVLTPEKSISALNMKSLFKPMSEELFNAASTENTETIEADPAPVAESTPELGAPAEFVAGFEFDESNPFLDSPFNDDSEAPPPVQTISSIPEPQYGGFAENVPVNGMPQQPMSGYPQPFQQPMGGYQQPFQQPMGGYPQPFQQPIGGYPQPYQQPMGGYQQPFQQPMGGYQQPFQQPMGGYPQPYQAEAPNPPAYGQVNSSYYQSQNIDTNDSDNESNMMKNRLASLLGSGNTAPAEPSMSKEEMLKRSKEMKKAARLNEKMKKQF